MDPMGITNPNNALVLGKSIKKYQTEQPQAGTTTDHVHLCVHIGGCSPGCFENNGGVENNKNKQQ